ncbi:MAG: AAA family ATPase [Lachnospiraceae bacterium]|jgi:predicted AAA+ superfamily ATPase|nr:AAA family ATPase [Lachnospiraceae bacterium]
MILKRKIYNELVEWKNYWNGRTAIMLEGARRVGKSTIVKQFAMNEYKSYILLDFGKIDSEIIDLFEYNSSNLEQFFLKLQAITGKHLYERQSIIIFDEIQLYPKARQLIKYLVEDGRYDYIETGSLISIYKNIKDILIPSEELSMAMNPLDFEEFLWAIGNDMLYPYLQQCFNERKPVGIIHRKAMDLFRQYMLVGGMPQAVVEFLESNNFENVDREKRNILKLYRTDVVKFAERYETKVMSIFDDIPSQLSRHEKKFKMSSISKDARLKNYENAFTWLREAKIINV